MVQTNTTVLLAFNMNTGGECSRSEAENQVQGLTVLIKSSGDKKLPQIIFFLLIF